MNNRPVPELQTDPEFDELIQPREEKYLEGLEENIFDHGCQEPVCVWNGIILDGRLYEMGYPFQHPTHHV